MLKFLLSYRHLFAHLIFLLVCFLIPLQAAENTSLFVWPLSPVIAFGFVTFIFISFWNKQLASFKYLQIAIYSIIFGVVSYMLSTLFIILLERLFQVSPESYSIYQLKDAAVEQLPILFLGIIWFGIAILIEKVYHQYNLTKSLQKELAYTKKSLASQTHLQLASDLNPHFLFNAMNNINMLIRSNQPDTAIEMTEHLASLMRRAYSQKNSFIKLSEELEFIQQYLELQALRHNNIEVTIDIPDEIMHAKMPNFVLQPLVENAFIHGIDKSEFDTKKLILKAEKSGSKLIISVENTGAFESPWHISQKSGIGLRSTVERLTNLYGSESSFQILEQDQMVKILIKIPYDTAS